MLLESREGEGRIENSHGGGKLEKKVSHYDVITGIELIFKPPSALV